MTAPDDRAEATAAAPAVTTEISLTQLLGTIEEILRVLPQYGYSIARLKGWTLIHFEMGAAIEGSAIRYVWMPIGSATFPSLMDALRHLLAALLPLYEAAKRQEQLLAGTPIVEV